MPIKKNIVFILTACDSEKHLSSPVLEELKKFDDICPIYIPVKQNDIVHSYNITRYMIDIYSPKLVLAVADRPEQVGGVLAAFHEKVPIAHMYAGDLNTIATFDNTNRHTISLYSDILLCSCQESADNARKLLQSVGNSKTKVFVVGATHFDGIDYNNIDLYNISRYIPYLLVLINSETAGDDKRLVDETVNEILIRIKENPKINVIIAKGNGDDDLETTLLTKLNSKTDGNISIICENRKDHLLFLLLIRRCEAFITNSSSAVYEAPFWLDEEKIIHIGNRNRNRTPIPNEAHDGLASKRIAQIISNYLNNNSGEIND